MQGSDLVTELFPWRTRQRVLSLNPMKNNAKENRWDYDLPVSRVSQNSLRTAEENVTKPIVGFVAGATAPPGKRMGHAGAIISGGKGTAEEKFAAFEAAGIACAKDPSELGSVLLESLKKAGLR